jgi:hypothetical protein
MTTLAGKVALVTSGVRTGANIVVACGFTAVERF